MNSSSAVMRSARIVSHTRSSHRRQKSCSLSATPDYRGSRVAPLTRHVSLLEFTVTTSIPMRYRHCCSPTRAHRRGDLRARSGTRGRGKHGCCQSKARHQLIHNQSWRRFSLNCQMTLRFGNCSISIFLSNLDLAFSSTRGTEVLTYRPRWSAESPGWVYHSDSIFTPTVMKAAANI